jgi:hypothetical protein
MQALLAQAHYQSLGHTLVKQWSNLGQTEVKHWSKYIKLSHLPTWSKVNLPPVAGWRQLVRQAFLVHSALLARTCNHNHQTWI